MQLKKPQVRHSTTGVRGLGPDGEGGEGDGAIGAGDGAGVGTMVGRNVGLGVAGGPQKKKRFRKGILQKRP